MISLSKLCLFLVSGVTVGFAQVDQTEFFEIRVRPLLANNCYACHAGSKLGGLQVDSREALLQGGKSGPAIVLGKSASESLLIKAVSQADARLKMPLGGAKLKDEEIADLARWIEMGAPWPENKQEPSVTAANKSFVLTPEKRNFWSFQPIQKPAAPSVKDKGWVKNPVDNFILAKLEQIGLKPLKPADKRVLIRRASYDLIGLPPTSEEIDAFEKDSSPDAFAKVVDRLLASSHYGERWGRHWLDVARYADGEGEGGPPPPRDTAPAADGKRPRARGARGMTFVGYGMTRDGFANTWRYRDWVIDAFNEDMPYDLFVKAQIAADLLPDKEQSKKLLPGLGLFGVGPWYTNDCVVFTESRAEERDTRIDVLTKGFLGLTVTCARCHNHKYDPISQKDYYSLAGIFNSSGYWEYNLAQDELVAQSRAYQAKVRSKQSEIGEFMELSAIDVAARLARQTSRYMMAGRKVLISKPKLDAAAVAAEEKLHPQIFQRWIKYLGVKEREHAYLREWDAMMARGGGKDEDAHRLAEQFQKLVLAVIAEKRDVELANRDLRNNYKPDANEASVLLPGDLMQFELFQFKHGLIEKVIDPKKYYVWMDVVQGPPVSRVDDYGKRTGIFELKEDDLIELFTPEENAKLESLEDALEALRKDAPKDHPYVMGLADNGKPANMKLNIRGNPNNLGEEVPRGFPAVLAGAARDPLPFTKGSGRLELAERIVSHPLTPRVIVNRIWMEHFGRGIVGTTTNLGMMGDRPTHPELLDYLASRLMENHWSMKAVHREILLSATYQLSYGSAEPNEVVDQDNRLLWRANLRRLDVEQLRDSLLFAAGILDERLGGPGQSLNQASNKKRTVYSRIARSGPNRLLDLFDFPDPNISIDQRGDTNVPLQGLFFINSDLICNHAGLVLARLGSS